MDELGADDVVVVANLTGSAGALHSIGCAVVENESPCGYGENLNRGVRALRGRHAYLLLLNDDALPERGAIEKLVEALECDPHAGIAGPSLRDDDDRPVPHRFRFPNLYTMFTGAIMLPGCVGARLPGRWRAGSHDQRAEWALGAALLVRAEAFSAVGGFDPSFFLNFEEVDFTRRLAEAGWTVCAVPAAVVHHVGHASIGPALMDETFVESFSRYVAIHWTKRQRLALPIVLLTCRLWNAGVAWIGRWVLPSKRYDLAAACRAKQTRLPRLRSVWRHAGAVRLQSELRPATDAGPALRLRDMGGLADAVPRRPDARDTPRRYLVAAGIVRSTLAFAPQFRPATSAAFRLGARMATRCPLQVGHLRSGSRIVVNVQEFAHRQIFFFGTYEEPTTALLQRLAKPGWTFLDVGANAGYFSLLAADLGGSSSSVVAFEPNAQLAAMLAESIRLNSRDGDESLKLVQAACSDSDGVSVLHLSPDPGNSGLSSLEQSVSRGWTKSASADVATIRLDAWCQANGYVPHIVKIDVEGHELAVVRGMAGLLTRHRPEALIIELSSDPPRRHPAAAVVDLLGGFGYRGSHIALNGRLLPMASSADIDGVENICFLRNTVGTPTTGAQIRAAVL